MFQQRAGGFFYSESGFIIMNRKRRWLLVSVYLPLGLLVGLIVWVLFQLQEPSLNGEPLSHHLLKLQDGHSDSYLLSTFDTLLSPCLLKLHLVLAVINLSCDSLLAKVSEESFLHEIWVTGSLELGTLFEGFFVWHY